MANAELLSTIGFIRTSRRRGFCPACSPFRTDDGPQEIAAPALMALAFLVIAAAAWVLIVARMSSMEDMRMGLGPIDAFAAGWTVMMAAMMLPSAVPLVVEFARRAEGRRGWRAATTLVGITYLGVWLAFGLICYVLYNAVGMPWPQQSLIGGAALIIAGVYAWTPLQRASEARCRELCALHGALPFNLMRSAVVVGVRYGLSCLGCTAGLMLTVLLIGLSNLAWMIVVAAVVLIYKVAPDRTTRWRVLLAGVLMALGVLYAAST